MRGLWRINMAGYVSGMCVILHLKRKCELGRRHKDQQGACLFPLVILMYSFKIRRGGRLPPAESRWLRMEERAHSESGLPLWPWPCESLSWASSCCVCRLGMSLGCKFSPWRQCRDPGLTQHVGQSWRDRGAHPRLALPCPSWVGHFNLGLWLWSEVVLCGPLPQASDLRRPSGLRVRVRDSLWWMPSVWAPKSQTPCVYPDSPVEGVRAGMGPTGHRHWWGTPCLAWTATVNILDSWPPTSNYLPPPHSLPVWPHHLQRQVGFLEEQWCIVTLKACRLLFCACSVAGEPSPVQGHSFYFPVGPLSLFSPSDFGQKTKLGLSPPWVWKAAL